MAEPSFSAFVVTGAVAAALGPVMGPAALIVFGAVAGSMLAMVKTDTDNWREALKFILVGVFIALAITGAAAWALEKYLGVPANVALMPVAAIIGAVRNSILALMETLVGLLGSLARGRGGQ